jgi:hypothetical protein
MMTRRERRSPSMPLIVMMAVVAAASMFGCGARKTSDAAGGIAPRQFTDALHKVLSADRTIYTKKVVQRLTQDDKVIAASERFQDERALPLPAQMFRMGAELVSEDPDAGFSYSLQSLWPINRSNAAHQTEVEKKGLQHVLDHKGESFYGEETLGQRRYFTAVYPDVAVAEACIACHNAHKDSPRHDFKVGDVMGGVVIRVALRE